MMKDDSNSYVSVAISVKKQSFNRKPEVRDGGYEEVLSWRNRH